MIAVRTTVGLVLSLLAMPCAIGVVWADPVGVTPPSANSLGQISYVQGSVTVVRDEHSHTTDVVLGFPLENFDQITTGKDSSVKITLNSATGFEGTITVQPDTSFCLELSAGAKARQCALELLNGSLALKVKKVMPDSLLDVRTAAAVMSTRRTQVDVTTAVSGNLLVSVEEGIVACRNVDGETLYAAPERAVEQIVEGQFKNIPVDPARIDNFRKKWMQQQAASFKAHAPHIALFYVRRFTELQTEFDRAYESLMSNRGILDRWLRQNREHRPIGGKSVEAERAQIRTAVVRMRRVQYIFERAFHRLAVLERYYQQIGRWPDTSSVSFARFFSEFDNKTGQISERLRTIRYVAKMFVQRGGKLLLESLPTLVPATQSSAH